jgi:hypothetical protein
MTRIVKRYLVWIAAILVVTSPLARADFSAQSASSPESAAQHFGLNLGMGVLLASGYRGQLWQPAQPTYDLTALYWITNHLALGLELSQASDSYTPTGGNRVNVGISHVELNARVYANLRSVAPALGFVSPFLAVGGGAYLETQSAPDGGLVAAQDLEPGMSVSAGLKFNIIPQSVAFELAGRWDSVTFKDSYSQQFASQGIPSLSGQLFGMSGSLSVLF